MLFVNAKQAGTVGQYPLCIRLWDQLLHTGLSLDPHLIYVNNRAQKPKYEDPQRLMSG